MRSTMQDGPLLISGILRHGQQVYPDSKIITVEAEGYRTSSFTEVGGRAERLAKALARPRGWSGDRVGPSAGTTTYGGLSRCPLDGSGPAYLEHPALPRTAAFVDRPAEDKVLLVDGSLIPLLARSTTNSNPLKRSSLLVRRRTPLGETLNYEGLLAGGSTGYRVARVRREGRCGHVLHNGNGTGNPKGVVYSHRSTVLHSDGGHLGVVVGMTERDRTVAIFPMFHANAWGPRMRGGGGHRTS